MLIKRIQEIAPKKTDRNGLGSLPSTIRLQTLASDSMKINLALLFFLLMDTGSLLLQKQGKIKSSRRIIIYNFTGLFGEYVTFRQKAHASPPNEVTVDLGRKGRSVIQENFL